MIRNIFLLFLALCLAGCQPARNLKAEQEIGTIPRGEVGKSEGDIGTTDRSPVNSPSRGLVFHALLMADVQDHYAQPGGNTIAPGTGANLKRMQGFVSQIKAATGMDTDLQVFRGDAPEDATYPCSSIYRAIDSVQVKPGDVVFVYYAGHGFNEADPSPHLPGVDPLPLKSDMPYLACNGAAPNVRAVAGIVSKSSPKLVVVMADACNSFIHVRNPSPLSVTAFPFTNAEPDQRLVGLFAESSGTVLLTAAPSGHYAFYDSDGGRFTKALLDTVQRPSRSRHLTWIEVGNTINTIQATFIDPEDGLVKSDRQRPVVDVYAGLLPVPARD